MVFAFVGFLQCWVSCKQETIREQMWCYISIAFPVQNWAEPFGNFPVNCTLGCVRCDWLYVMAPRTPAWNRFRQPASCNERYFSSVCYLKILRAGFSPQLCKRSCREIVPVLPAAGGRWDSTGLALSSLQAFPEKDRRDYGLCWLQVVTLCDWGTQAARPSPLVIQDVVRGAQINIIMYNPLSSVEWAAWLAAGLPVCCHVAVVMV